MLSLDGQVAVVTGGTRGLGLAISRALAAAGAVVVAASRRPDSDASPDVGINREQVDVTDPDSVDALMRRVTDVYGGPDIVVANAGISRDARLASLSVENWRATIDTNLSGTFYTLRAAIAQMTPLGGGRIITISSCMADRPAVGAGAYAVTKAGIRTLTEAAALENGRNGFRVNCIAPGILDTGLGDDLTNNVRAWEKGEKHLALGKVGEAGQIGQLVVFLAGPDSTCLNGATIAADGGISQWT